jgi:hypothetical protein
VTAPATARDSFMLVISVPSGGTSQRGITRSTTDRSTADRSTADRRL